MPDVLIGDKYKRIIKIATDWVLKKLGTSVIEIHDDMRNCGNPIFNRITNLINVAADSVEEKYQQNMIRKYGEIICWILYKDTAYKDPSLWILYQLLCNAEAIKEEIKPYVKNPEDWYVNTWHRSKENTKKARKDGDLPETMKSLDESIFTPEEQKRRLNRYRK